MRCALPAEFIESMKFLEVTEYAGGAQTMRPYPLEFVESIKFLEVIKCAGGAQAIRPYRRIW
jgi:hypothetical protein